MAYNEVPLQMIANEENIHVCPECGCEDIAYEHGERYCKKCGFVIE